MTGTHFRLPAEWEPQAAVLIAWPHEGTDWGPRLLETESSYVALVSAIARFERVVICAPDDAVRERAIELLAAGGANLSNVGFVEIPYNDTWLRDSGPITLRSGDEFTLVDFRFTGWGGKFEGSRDDALITGLIERDVFAPGIAHARYDWALEGGAIESDGRGTLLTTWRCLHQRHPNLSREEMTEQLRESLGAQRVLWLTHGYLQGDDTDAHIDTLARFVPDHGIVFQACEDADDPHFAELAAMRGELEALRTPDGLPYKLHALPWPKPIIDEDRRLAASYANYLVINDAVLAPAYGDSADLDAARIIGEAHPGREVVQIPCRPLIWQNGSLHCVTMQLPEGALA